MHGLYNSGILLITAAKEDLNPELVYTTYNRWDTLLTPSGSIDTVVSVRTTMPFKGVKLMGRGQVDFKKMLNLTSDFWGAEDLRLYGEVAVIGLKDYPLNTEGRGYNDIRERIPVMAGITMPTYPLIGNFLVPAGLSLFLIGIESDSVFIDKNKNDTTYTERGFGYKPYRPYVWGGVSLFCGALTTVLEKTLGRKFRLDKIAIEAEYCASPYNNNHTGTSTLPEFIFAFDQQTGNPVGTNPWHKDDWRWAVVANKKIFERVSMNLKLASSHITVRDPQGFNTIVERLFAYYEWYWQMGVHASF